MNLKFAAVLWMGACLFTGNAENLLNLPEYEQSFPVTFRSPEDARKAELKTRPLPKRYSLAFSARWDDSTPGHGNTIDVMARHGAKGTFFFNRKHRGLAGIVERIQKNGSTIGLHTVSHPILSGINPNEQFYEYMRNLIELESSVNAPVTSQVLPFCIYTSPSPCTREDIGRIMRTVGVIVTPDVFYPDFGKRLGYPEGALAESRPIVPGDKVVDRPRFDRQFEDALKNKNGLARHPSISIAMHSWHTPEALKDLEKVFLDKSGNPDWWYCNHNEYGAYRYEALQPKISKQLEGNKAIFTVRRIRPEWLGASVPLWLECRNAVPVEVAGAKLTGAMIELPHAPEQTLPVLFDAPDAAGNYAKMPFLKMKLTHPSARNWTLTVANQGKTPLTDITVSFYFPPQWKTGVIREKFASLPPEKSITCQAAQGEPSAGCRFRMGRPYYAARIDFLRDGKRMRAYADLREAEIPALTISRAARTFYSIPADFDLAAVSRVGAPMEIPGGKELAVRPLDAPAVGYLNLQPQNRAGTDKQRCVSIVEFTPAKVGELRIPTNAEAIFLNAVKYLPSNGAVTLPLQEGRNRMAVENHVGGRPFVFLNDPVEAQFRVQFHPLK